MTKDKRKILFSIILGIAILVLIAILIYLFNQIKGESQNLIFQESRFAELGTKVQNLKKYQETREIYRENLEKIDKLFINPAEPIEFIKFLEKEATVSQLSIEITPFPPEEILGDPWPSMKFKLTLVGPFPDFLKFLEKLESGLYLIKVLNLSTGRLAEGDITATLLIKTYFK